MRTRNHSPLLALVAIIAAMLGSMHATAQLPVRTRQVLLYSDDNAHYTTLRSANGQVTNWSLIQPPTVGTSGSIQLSTVAGSDAQLSWLPVGSPGFILGVTAGMPGWVDPATYLNGSFWSLTGNAATNPATNYLGTSDAQPLVFRTNGTEAGRYLTTGELQLATIAGAINATIPAGFDRFLVADASGTIDQVEYAAVINQNAWSLTGNAATNPATNYLGTSDAQPLVIRTNATEALRVLSTGQVGIGTATPGELLEVEDGNVLISTSIAGTAGRLQFQEDGASGNNVVTLQAPSALATDNNYTLPAAYPAAANYVLTSTLAGTMAWSDPNTLVDNFWSLTGNAATNPATNYLGTSDAQPLVFRTNGTEAGRYLTTGELQLATIAGAINATIPVGFDRFLVADASGTIDQVEYAAVINQNAWSLTGNAATNPATNYLGTSDAQPLVIRTNATEALRVLSTGQVGIGTATPGELLEVEDGNVLISTSIAGTAGRLQFQEDGASGNNVVTLQAPSALAADNNYTLPAAYPAAANYVLTSTMAGTMAWSDPNTLVDNFWSLTGNAATNPATNYVGTSDAQPLVIRTNATEALRVLSTGQVGIGTATPGELLEVEDGNVLISTSIAGTAGRLQFQEDGASGNNVVTFQAPSALAADNNYTLPAAYPVANNYLLVSTTAGVMSWADPGSLGLFWTLTGNSGTNPLTNFLGTTDAQPLVFRTNNVERARLNASGELGLGVTAAAGYQLHVGGVAGTENVRLASLGAASLDVVVAANEGIVTADVNGDLRRRSTPDLFTVLGIGRGIYAPVASASTFVIPTTGFDLQAGATINVTVVGPSGPAVHAMVTATDAVANTITVGTSATIGVTYAIHWMIINP